jgi:predicted TIM-barrel fold metal-dependent hydrolase
MAPIIDLEIEAPKTEATKQAGIVSAGRPGNPFPESLDRPEGYGFANYSRIFGGARHKANPEASTEKETSQTEKDGDGMAELVADMDKASIEYGLLLGVENSEIGRMHREYPNRFKLLAYLNPMDGMRAVRELERLVREDGANGFRVSPLYNCLPANDRRYYPLYAKCVELGVPVRIYSTMSYANDRPYDLGHPRHLDDIAIDFPELKIIAALAGWPWIGDMVGLLSRHPNLYCDTAAHRPKYFGKEGSGWEMFLQFGNSRLQDKVMVGLSRYIFNCPFEELIEEYHQLPIKEAVMEKWLYHNAANFFAES